MPTENLPPLHSSLWPEDLSRLHGDLLRMLCVADDLLQLASQPNTEESLYANGLALAQALWPLGKQLAPLLPELKCAHQLSGTTLSAFAGVPTTSACELVQGIICYVAGMYLLPLDDTHGPVHWNVRLTLSKQPSADTKEVRKRLRSVPQFDSGELRRLVENEIGLAARFRLDSTKPTYDLNEKTKVPPLDGDAGQAEGTDDRTQRHLKPSREKAYRLFLWAMEQKPDLKTDWDVYGWLSNHTDLPHELPAFKAWAKYLRDARAYYKDHKRTPQNRKSASGKTVIRRNQI